MFQNRVDPYGCIIKTPERGAWLGNRGVIHNAHQQIVRPYKLKAWITCALQFKGRHRKIMQPNRWTELFFLDEATAFSAGHRPCAECRYADNRRFKAYWIKGNPQYGFDMKTPLARIDEIIHAERIAADGSKVTYNADPRMLRDGVFISLNNHSYLLKNKQLHLWLPGGYDNTINIPETDTLPVLTPRSIVNMFDAGFIPQMA
ncbi:hypothetical protein EWM62_01690 [Mucilaginibacter terrigena]|uniref:Uncharacterized protein n=1 Tax=Mucilaginibacter terrigena TaxID=2492395 RepID=A0A4Q5LS14_9SPHI|nr:hypothetical protein [Mucilaginibacter terrigena]RYU92173.1 hypothetical protein EWM62_01690 [Mucilaginibacter terrigena]